MAHEIQRLQARHYKMMDLHLAGMDTKAIAEVMGKSAVGVGQVINSPIFQAEVSRRRASGERAHDEGLAHVAVRAKQVIEDNAENAAQKVVDLMDDEDSSIQFKSATHILDRVFGRGDKEDKRPTILIEGDALLNLQVAIRESA